MEKLKNWISRFDRWMMAVTFAEAGEFETAIGVITPEARKQERKRARVRVVDRPDHRPRLRV
jgi:hypothetical protein